MLRYTFQFKKQHRISTQERFKRIQAAQKNERQLPIPAGGKTGDLSHGENAGQGASQKVTENQPASCEDAHEPAEIITLNDIKKHAAISVEQPAQTGGNQAPGLQQAPQRSGRQRKANLPANAGRKISRRRRGRNSVKK